VTHTVTTGQTYRSNRPTPLGPARIRITAYTPGAPSANAVDPDTGAGCVVLAADLHATAPTGDARHDGYTLERADDDTDDGFDFEAIARSAHAQAVAAGDTRAARALAACLPRPLTPEQQRRALEATWTGVIRNSSFGKTPPGVTRIP
jgi:hypothetical protein